MIDHTAIEVADLQRSHQFYESALTQLGYRVINQVLGDANVIGYIDNFETDFWISQGHSNKPTLHIAFRAADRRQVEEFHRAALAAGGRDNGAPGLRPEYHAHYYAAFVLDPDGHNIEAVCHDPL